MCSRRSTITLIAAIPLMLAACAGGGSAGGSPTVAAPTAGSVAVDVVPATSGAQDVPAGDAASGYEPGPIGFRVVNLLDEPVDLYVRTSGLVQAWSVATDVTPGEVSALYSPPRGGTFVVTTADAGEPECVGQCAHFVTEQSAVPDHGPTRTIVLHDANGTPAALDLWEHAGATTDTSNDLPAAVADAALAVVVAIDVTDADFGLRLGWEGTPGCQESHLDGVLIGGTQTPAFRFAGSVAALLYDNQDRECAGEPVGGPFAVTGTPGERVHVILTGSPGSLTAIVLPFVDSDGTAAVGAESRSADAPADPSAGVDRQAAVAHVAADLAAEIGLEADDAACLADAVVEALGLDVVVVDGQLVDFETLGDAEAQAAIDAVVAAIPGCDIDPATLG